MTGISNTCLRLFRQEITRSIKTIAVSYTHLESFPWDCAAAAASAAVPGSGILGLAALAAADALFVTASTVGITSSVSADAPIYGIRSVPVSYTHLDVYKRQTFASLN